MSTIARLESHIQTLEQHITNTQNLIQQWSNMIVILNVEKQNVETTLLEPLSIDKAELTLQNANIRMARGRGEVIQQNIDYITGAIAENTNALGPFLTQLQATHNLLLEKMQSQVGNSPIDDIDRPPTPQDELGEFTLGTQDQFPLNNEPDAQMYFGGKRRKRRKRRTTSKRSKRR